MNYVVQLVLLNSIGVDAYGNTGRAIFVSHIAFVVLSGFLTWRILARQPLWAAIFAAAWCAIELIIKVVMMSRGERYAITGLIFTFAVIPAAAVIGIRGSLKLRQLRSPARVAELFD